MNGATRFLRLESQIITEQQPVNKRGVTNTWWIESGSGSSR